MEQFDQVQQLMQSVQSLTIALTEERKERLANQKRQRTFLVGTLAAVMVTGWLAWPGTSAHAVQTELDNQAINQLVQGLNGMMASPAAEQFVNNIGTLVTGLNGLMASPNAEKFVGNIGDLVTGLNGMLMMASESMGPQNPNSHVLYDVGVLMTRFKQDSDVLRKSMFAPPPSTLATLPASLIPPPPPFLSAKSTTAEKLEYNNKQLAYDAVLGAEPASTTKLLLNPTMGVKGEMNFLNRNIAELTYYIRSTVGRASTYMNWMPTAP